MQIRIHGLATTTPKTREYIWKQINEGKRSTVGLARELGITKDTVRKWARRKYGEFFDRKHVAIKLMTKLTKIEEEVIILLREQTRLSIRDIAIVMRENALKI